MTEKKYRSVKCPYCDQPLDRNTEPYQEHGNRYYHQKCFDIRHADIKQRNDLYEYICELQEIDFLNTSVMKQIKEYQEPPRNFTLRGMLTTLKYAHEVEGVPVKKDVGIGIVEYYYKRAIAYHTNLAKIRNNVAKLDNVKYETEVIYIKPPKKREKKMIDLGGLD